VTLTNHRILLRSRPVGVPQPDDFVADSEATRRPGADEVLLETVFLSIDPAMRSWMTENPGYQQAVPLGSVMRGGGIGRVLESRSSGFQPGELVQARLGWQTHPTLPARYLQKLDLAKGDALAWIGPLGLSGVTAYFGMRDIGAVKPGDRVLVSGAAGGVGQVAVQIAGIEACYVAGIAGGVEKCAYLSDELRLDAVVDYKAESDLSAAIGRACPDGVDLYFDNVGGRTLDAALLHLRPEARVVLCGRISQVAVDPPYGVRNLGQLLTRRARMQGFQVFGYHDRYEEARAWLAARHREGQLRQRLHILEGLHHAPGALGMLFRGENNGKLVVRVS
jgi:NADPH-dependent curcumin reductase CurA